MPTSEELHRRLFGDPYDESWTKGGYPPYDLTSEFCVWWIGPSRGITVYSRTLWRSACHYNSVDAMVRCPNCGRRIQTDKE
jgi:hypothetical protein